MGVADTPLAKALILTHILQDEPPRRATSVRDRCPPSCSDAIDRCALANTASIRGSSTLEAGRSGSSRAQAHTCNKRTARGDNRPEPPHQAHDRDPCRSSMQAGAGSPDALLQNGNISAQGSPTPCIPGLLGSRVRTASAPNSAI